MTLTTVCVRHVDLTPVGDGRRPSDIDGPLGPGEVVAVALGRDMRVGEVAGALEQAAGAAGVDVDHVFLEQAIDGRLDRGQGGTGAAVVVDVGEGFGGEGHGR